MFKNFNIFHWRQCGLQNFIWAVHTEYYCYVNDSIEYLYVPNCNKLPPIYNKTATLYVIYTYQWLKSSLWIFCSTNKMKSCASDRQRRCTCRSIDTVSGTNIALLTVQAPTQQVYLSVNLATTKGRGFRWVSLLPQHLQLESKVLCSGVSNTSAKWVLIHCVDMA